jgi:AcrR family transcriptional regulator
MSVKKKRVRRSSEVAREEILAAAERLLTARPFSELTVGTLMSNTAVGRSTFYLYFADRAELAVALLQRLKAALFEAAAPWLDDNDADPVHAMRQAIAGVVSVWHESGPVLRGIAEAAHESEAVNRAWREGFIDTFVQAVIHRMPPLPGSTDRREMARALILMNEAYLLDRLGRRGKRPRPEPITATLTEIWVRALYR